MCHSDRSRSRTDERTTSESRETDDATERKESPSRGIVDVPVRALKQAYAVIA